MNLKYIDNPGETNDKIVLWAKIFKAKTLKELEELAGEQEVFKKMVLTLRKLSKDEKIKQQMEARADYESRIATARNAGFRDGVDHQKATQQREIDELNETIKEKDEALADKDAEIEKLRKKVEELERKTS